MGGYWSIRAAAFEKRIRRVIAFPPVYDWLEMAGAFNRRLVRELMKRRKLMKFLVRLKMMNRRLKHVMHRTLCRIQKTEPIDAVDWLLAINREHLHSEKVDQDVLLLGSENDVFQQPKLVYKQERGLTNARSVTTHILTKAEHADQHCARGNIGLALQVMLDWLEKTAERYGEYGSAASAEVDAGKKA